MGNPYREGLHDVALSAAMPIAVTVVLLVIAAAGDLSANMAGDASSAGRILPGFIS